MLHVSTHTEAIGRTLRPSKAWPHQEANHLVVPELFRDRVEAETARHARYLSGVGVMRVGLRRGRLGAEALREAVETETRRTDSVCAYPDGSHAILAVNAGRRAMEALARRLDRAARDIARGNGASAPELVTGAAAAEERRVNADELWMAANDALEVAVETASDLTFARWD